MTGIVQLIKTIYSEDKARRLKLSKERTKAIRNYLDFYYESGIIAYFSKQARKKFKIPNMDPNDDKQIHHDIYPMEDGAVIIHENDWLHNQHPKIRNQFHEFVREIAKQLYLPSICYNLLKFSLIYGGKKPSIYPTTNIDTYLDLELVDGHITIKDDYAGFTSAELDCIKERFIEIRGVTDKEFLYLLDKEFNRMKQLYKPKIRPLKDTKTKIKLVRELKKYKSEREGEDTGTGETETYSYGSTEIAEKIYKKFDETDSARVRKNIQELYRKFPFLRDMHNS